MFSSDRAIKFFFYSSSCSRVCVNSHNYYLNSTHILLQNCALLQYLRKRQLRKTWKHFAHLLRNKHKKIPIGKTCESLWLTHANSAFFKCAIPMRSAVSCTIYAPAKEVEHCQFCSTRSTDPLHLHSLVLAVYDILVTDIVSSLMKAYRNDKGVCTWTLTYRW